MHSINLSTPWTRAPNGVVAGVCAGLGERLSIPPNVLRIIWVAALLFAGTGLLLYLVFWWVLPMRGEEPVEPTQWLKEPGQPHRPVLVRTRVDRKLLGVCGGLARRFEWDPALVRLATLSLATFSLGLVALAYFGAAIFIPSGDQPRLRPHPVDF